MNITTTKYLKYSIMALYKMQKKTEFNKLYSQLDFSSEEVRKFVKHLKKRDFDKTVNHIRRKDILKTNNLIEGFFKITFSKKYK